MSPRLQDIHATGDASTPASKKLVERRLREAGGELSADQRSEIAQDELKQLRQRVASAESDYAASIDLLLAGIRETDMAIRDTEKESWEFNRDVVVRGENKRTGKIDSAVVTRWMEERKKRMETALSKLKSKSRDARRQLRHAEKAAEAHDEGSERLRDIDFHQLKIENAQYLAKIKERNSQLLDLKLSTGKTMQVLASKKSRLAELIAQCEQLQTGIARRTGDMERLRRENARVTVELRKDTVKAEKLGVAVDESEDLPGVQDYVDLRAEHTEMMRELESWRRKVEIAEMGAKKAAARAGLAKRALDGVTPGAVHMLAATSGSKLIGAAATTGSIAVGSRAAVGPAGGKSGSARALRRTMGPAPSLG